MNIKKYIKEHKDVLDAYIKDVLEARKYNDPGVSALYSVFIDSGEGGKCVRGSLVKLGYELASGNKADARILPVSAAFEIFQTAVLSHDDIIDKSPLRRGKPSIWKKIADSGSSHYGISQAICLGDFGIVFANNLISNSKFPDAVKIKGVDVFNNVEINTLNGEMLDVQMTENKDYSDEKRILAMSYLKTAWYTIIGPLQLGAVFGGAGEDFLNLLESFGENLGIAFQLKDDILGVCSSEDEIGKSALSDIAEGKVTLLIHYALKSAETRERLFSLYGKNDITPGERDEVVDIFDRACVFSKVEEKASSYLANAKGIIEKLTDDEEYIALLNDLSDFMVERKS